MRTPAPTLAELRRRYRRRRRLGLRNVPVVTAAAPFRAYPVTYPYGVKDDQYAAGHHTGQDYAVPEGSLAVAPTWGVVIWAGYGSSWGPAYGCMVIIRTATGLYDYGFCHLSEATVTTGQRVTPGQVVGHTGQTGNATGPHLHFETRPAGGAYGSDIPPRYVLRPGRGT